MTVLIGITGKAGSGKDTIAGHLKQDYNFASVAFATPLKEGVKAMFDLDDSYLDHPLKEQILPHIGKSPRQLMQLLGTEYGRNLVREDLWLVLAEEKIKMFQDFGFNVVLTDVRFENEANMIRSKGGVIVSVERGKAGTSFAHASEAGVGLTPDDFVIDNNGTISELYAQVDSVMQEVYVKRIQTETYK